MSGAKGLEHVDDWMKEVVCPVCSALPCSCDEVTASLEAMYWELGRTIRKRHAARQAELVAREKGGVAAPRRDPQPALETLLLQYRALVQAQIQRTNYEVVGTFVYEYPDDAALTATMQAIDVEIERLRAVAVPASPGEVT